MGSPVVRIALFGALGRMGTSLIDVAEGTDDLELVALVDRAAASREPPPAHTPVTAALGDDVSVDVIVDFTAPPAAQQTSALAVKRRCGLVIGTTSLDASDLQAVRRAGQTVAVVMSPNMSIGVNLLYELVRRSTAVLVGYDVEILEAHHRGKLDSPSGTATHIIDVVEDVRGRPSPKLHGRHGTTQGRSQNEIGVHAIRGGDVTGDHHVLFLGDGERVELTHRTTSRRAFALGTVRAIRFVATAKPGLYGMKEVLGTP